MSVPNPPLVALRPLPLPVDSDEPVAAAHAAQPWLNWCTSVIDRAFGFELRDEEMRQLLGHDRMR